MIPKSPLVQTNDRNINQLQSYIAQFLNYVNNSNIVTGNILPITKNGQVVPFFLQGSEVTSLALLSANNPTQISHYLGRELLGWVVIRKSANVGVWDSQASNTIAAGYAGVDKTLLLNVSANATLQLYVF